jgi:hypothetical protein
MDHGRRHVGNHPGRIGAVVAAALVGGVLAVALGPEAAISSAGIRWTLIGHLVADS